MSSLVSGMMRTVIDYGLHSYVPAKPAFRKFTTRDGMPFSIGFTLIV